MMTGMTALALGEKLKRKEIGVEEAVEAVFKEIEKREPRLNCFITLDRERALEDAGEKQKAILQGAETGPFFGVPIAVKDNLCTRGLRTTCGSRMLRDFVPAYDAEVIRRIRQAGMILVGKTNMDEFAMGNTTESSYFGPARNPGGEERSCGGSSGGSAGAVASGECFCALGSDTGGSVRQPAAHCGVVGIKPTYGTVSRYGLIAYASSMDQVGTLTKDVADGAALLEVIGGRDPKDATSVERGPLDFRKSIGQGAKGLRVGILKNALDAGLQREVEAAVLRTAGELEAAGARLGELSLGITEYAVPAYYTIACGEASSNLERYDGMKYGFRAQAKDLRSTYGETRSQGFGAEVKRRIMLGTYVLSEGFYDAYYLRALKVRRLIRDACVKAFEDYDVLLGPVAPTTAPRLGGGGENVTAGYLADKYTVPANLAGLPAMSLPCGTDGQGLPVGIQLTGNLFREDLMFRAAGALEKWR